MTFLRVKPVRKTNSKRSSHTYYYVYEVQSYKYKGKVKQKTLRLLGRYIKLKKLRQKKFPLKRALACDSKEQLFKEIFTLNLQNYGFRKEKENIFKHGNIVVDLGKFKVFDSTLNKDVYININDKFFGSFTLKKLFKYDSNDMFEFVRAIIDSGAIKIEFSDFKRHREHSKSLHDFKLLQIMLDKFGRCSDASKLREMSFGEFITKIGY